MIGLMLTGCGSVPLDSRTGLSDAKRQQFLHFHGQAAVTQEQQGHVHQALLHWRILAVAEPHDQKRQVTIDRLQQQIDTLSAAKLLRGREFVRKGLLKQARAEFLAVLMLDPSHAESVEQLRQLVSLQMQRKESRTAGRPRPYRGPEDGESYRPDSEDSLPPDPEDSLPSNPEPRVAPPPPPPPPPQGLSTALQRFQQLHEQGRHQDLIGAVVDAKFTAPIPEPLENWLLQAYLSVAQSLRSQGRLRASLDLIDQARVYPGQAILNQAFRRQVRRQIAVSLFAQGQERLGSDINQAIDVWQQALQYDPGYSEVRFQLEKAIRNRDKQRH